MARTRKLRRQIHYWSLPLCRDAILNHYNTHNTYPRQSGGDASAALGLPAGSRSWRGMDKWLRKQGTSLSRYCREIGVKVQWTVAKCCQAIREYYDKHQKLPAHNSGDMAGILNLKPGEATWAQMNAWLYRLHTSINKLIRIMGMGGPEFKWSLDLCETLIRDYYTTHGRKPSVASGDLSESIGMSPGSKSWKTMHHWLYTQGTTLAKFRRTLNLDAIAA